MASITIIQNPATYSPTIGEYSKTWSILNSTSSTQSNWKYVYTLNEINQTTGITTSIGEFLSPPIPNTGYGRVSFSDALNTTMTYDIQPFISTGTKAENSISRYFYNYGYQYDINQPCLNIGTYSGSNAFVIRYAVGPMLSEIQAGDTINLIMDNQSVNPQYNTNHNVLSTTTVFVYQYIEIDKPYLPSYT